MGCSSLIVANAYNSQEFEVGIEMEIPLEVCP